jgi:RHS repeat-associated protein
MDSVDRLRQYERGELSPEAGEGGQGGGSVIAPITLPGTDRFRNYDLDETGNWKRTSFLRAAEDQTTTEVRQHAPTNQLTKYGAVPVKYDHGDNADRNEPGAAARGNGNIADDGLRLWTYDAFNRPVAVSRKSDGQPIAAYRYDPLNRRVRKTVMNGGLTGDIPDGTTDYLYGPGTWQVMEERDKDDRPTKQYIWGLYIDECVLFRALQAIPRGPAPALPPGDYHPLQDLLYRTTALTDKSGAIAEAYDTDAYGNTLAFAAPGAGGNWWADDALQSDSPANEVLFCGYRLDPATQRYHVRNRSYNPSMGRWMQRDAMTYTAIATYDDAFHNSYLYGIANPTRVADPSGMCSRPTVASGQVGVCIDLFIAASNLPPCNISLLRRAGRGLGDNRGPAGDLPAGSKKYRVELHIVFTLGSSSVQGADITKDDPSTTVVVVGTPGVPVLWSRGTSTTTMQSIQVDEAGAMHLTILNIARNGLTGIPCSPKCSIRTLLKLYVTNDGKVGFDAGGMRTRFPSIEVYSYQPGSGGTIAAIYQQSETTVDELCYWDQHIPAITPHF